MNQCVPKTALNTDGTCCRGPVGTYDPNFTSRSIRSLHPGGAQFVLCDGSARFVSETIWSLEYWLIGDGTTTGAIASGQFSTYMRLYFMEDGQPVGDY